MPDRANASAVTVPTPAPHARGLHGRTTGTLQRWMESRSVLWGVFAASLAETTIVPIPIEVVLIPVMLTNCHRLWRIAGAALAGCLVGASIGYLIGYGAYGTVGEPLVEAMGITEQMTEYRTRMEDDGFMVVLVIALTPVPFQIGYLGAGLAQMPFLEFFGAAALGRGVRYVGLAILVSVLGRAAGPWLDRNKFRLALWATIAFVGGYAIVSLVA